MIIKLYYRYISLILSIILINLNVCYSSYHNLFTQEDDNEDQQSQFLRDNNQYNHEKTIYDIPVEIWRKITSYLHYSNKLHHVNRYFFHIVTDYPGNISDEGPFHHLKFRKQSSSQIAGIKIDFDKILQSAINRIPNYLWYSLVEKAIHCPLNLGNFLRYTRISYISLSKTGCGNADLRKRLPEMLSFYDLSQNDANDLRMLSNSLLGNSNDLSFNDDNVQNFIRELQGTSVTNLDLSSTDISANCILRIIELLKETSVRTLDLSDNSIGNEGLKKLFEALESTESDIERLYLTSNNIGDAGIGGIVGKLDKSNLHYLNLGDNKITNIGAWYLVQVLQESKVTQLSINKNKLSVEGIKLLDSDLKKKTLVRTVYYN